MADYRDLELQVQDIIQLNSNTVTTYRRVWTNEGRRELQRKLNFPEMRRFHPVSESDTTTFKLSSGNRELAAPANFKEVVGERDGLFLRDDTTAKLTPLRKRTFEYIADRWTLDDSGEPEDFVEIWSPSTKIATFQVYPKPDKDYPCRLHAYFFQADLASSGDLAGVEDFLTKDAFLAVRDAVLREAYMALEMRDMAVFAAQGNQARTRDVVSDANDRMMPKNLRMGVSLDAGRDEDRSEWGYPFWGKR